MASSIARAGLKRTTSGTSSPDVVAVFSSHTSARLLQRRGSLTMDDDPSISHAVPPTAAAAAAAAVADTTSSTTSSSARFDMEDINRRIQELERQPTQEEIDELLAQYDDYSDGSGSDIDSDDEDGRPPLEDVIMKVLVVGNARCGKTSTIRRFVSKDFSDVYTSTIGADFVEKVIDYDDQLRIHLQLWDIAGQDRFAKLTRAYFREAKGALIVCDITRENTIDAVVTWKNEIDACSKDLNNGENIPVVMVANKSDLLQDPMGALNIGVNMQKCVVNNGIIEWFRTSAKSGEHIDDAFQCLLDRMVQEHREHKTQQHDGSDASSDGASDSGYDHNKRDDVIRLSQFDASPHRARTDSGMCDCN